MKIALVSDSTADIPNHLVDKYNIRIMPNIVVIDGQSLEDGKDISRKEFYERLPHLANLPTTATASIGSYQQLYEDLLQEGIEHILSIHPPVKLSGIFNAASSAASAFENKVEVIDSGQISFGLGVQVLVAAEAARAGRSLEQVKAILEETRQRVRVIAMLDTMEFIRRSGRVSWARASLGSLLQIKPFIEVKDGDVNRFGEVRTRRKGVERLIEIANSQPMDRLAILHTNSEKDANIILNSLDKKPLSSPLVINVTTVIGTHVGPNGLGLAMVPA
jgi:DegV family protein with EDD domain